MKQFHLCFFLTGARSDKSIFHAYYLAVIWFDEARSWGAVTTQFGLMRPVLEVPWPHSLVWWGPFLRCSDHPVWFDEARSWGAVTTQFGLMRPVLEVQWPPSLVWWGPFLRCRDHTVSFHLQETFDAGLQAFEKEGIQTITTLKDQLVNARHAQTPAIEQRYNSVIARYSHNLVFSLAHAPAWGAAGASSVHTLYRGLLHEVGL